MAVEQSAQPQARGCPVHHQHAEGAEPAQRPAQCPVEHAQAAAGASAAIPAHGSGAPSGSGVPAQQQAQEVQPREEQPQEAQPEVEAKPMKCPLGFGSDNTAKLDPLNCVLCRSLYFQAAQTVCGHRFCRPCIEPFRDCPLCGADCKPLSGDAEMQATVDKYIDVHSCDHKLTNSGKATPQAEEEVVQHPAAARAAFYLQIGLRSFAGGNAAAALSRLRDCEAALLAQQAAEPDSAALATQLGAVCGSQGDACRKLQRPEEAAAGYKEAVRHLQSCAAPSAEAQHALTVSLNKLGDLRYMQGDLPAAREQYLQALDIRRTACDGGDGGGSAAQQLDLAASLVKVADVSGALGDAATQDELTAEARRLADGVDEAALNKAGAAKLGGLRAYFAPQQQAA